MGFHLPLWLLTFQAFSLAPCQNSLKRLKQNCGEEGGVFGWVFLGGCLFVPPPLVGGGGLFFPKDHSSSFLPPQSRGLYSLNNCTTELLLLTKHFRAMVTSHLFSHPTTNLQLTEIRITGKTLRRYMED